MRAHVKTIAYAALGDIQILPSSKHPKSPALKSAMSFDCVPLEKNNVKNNKLLSLTFGVVAVCLLR